MQTLTQRKDTNGKTGMIVKRVSVPIGLEELMEGLSKEVLLRKPKDLYIFASEYFSRMVNLREKSNKYKVHPVHSIQSVTQLKNLNIPQPKKISPARPSKHLSRQFSMRSKSPVQHRPTQTESITNRNIGSKSKERKISTDRRDSVAKTPSKIVSSRDSSKGFNTKGGTSTGTSSLQSTPREKRQSSVTRKVKSYTTDDQNKTHEEIRKSQKSQKRSKSEKVKTALISPTVIGGTTLAANLDVALAGNEVRKEHGKHAILDSDILAESTTISAITDKANSTDLKESKNEQVQDDNDNKMEFNDQTKSLRQISLGSSLDSDILAKSSNVAGVTKNISSEKDLESLEKNNTITVPSALSSNENKVSEVNSGESEVGKLEKKETVANEDDKQVDSNQGAKTIQTNQLPDDISTENLPDTDNGQDMEKNSKDITEQEHIQNQLSNKVSTENIPETDNGQDIEKKPKEVTEQEHIQNQLSDKVFTENIPETDNGQEMEKKIEDVTEQEHIQNQLSDKVSTENILETNNGQKMKKNLEDVTEQEHIQNQLPDNVSAETISETDNGQEMEKKLEDVTEPGHIQNQLPNNVSGENIPETDNGKDKETNLKDLTEQENIQNQLPDNISTKTIPESDNDRDMEKNSKDLMDLIQSTRSEIAVGSSANDGKLHIENDDNANTLKLNLGDEGKILKTVEGEDQILSQEKLGISNVLIEEKEQHLAKDEHESLENERNYPSTIKLSEKDDEVDTNLGNSDNLVSTQTPNIENNDTHIKNSTEGSEEVAKESIDFNNVKVIESRDKILASDNIDEAKTTQGTEENRSKDLEMADSDITLVRNGKEHYEEGIEGNNGVENSVGDKIEDKPFDNNKNEDEPIMPQNKNISGENKPEARTSSVIKASISGSPEKERAMRLNIQGSVEDQNILQEIHNHISQTDMGGKKTNNSEEIIEPLSAKPSESELSDLPINKEQNIHKTSKNEVQLMKKESEENSILKLDENQHRNIQTVSNNEQDKPMEITDSLTNKSIADNMISIKMKPIGKSNDVLIVSVSDKLEKEHINKESSKNENKGSECMENMDATSSTDVTKQEKNQFFREDEKLVPKQDVKTKVNTKNSDSEVTSPNQGENQYKMIKNSPRDSFDEKGTPNDTVSSESMVVRNLAIGDEDNTNVENSQETILNANQNNLSHKNDLTQKIINYEISKNQAGLIDSPVKKFLNSFINIEQSNVFKSKDLIGPEKDVHLENKTDEIPVPKEYIDKKGNDQIDSNGDAKIEDDIALENNENSKDTLASEEAKVSTGNTLKFSSVKDLLDFDNSVNKSDGTKINENSSIGSQNVENMHEEHYEETLDNDDVSQDSNTEKNFENEHLPEAIISNLQKITDSDNVSKEFDQMDDNKKKLINGKVDKNVSMVEEPQNAKIDGQTKIKTEDFETHHNILPVINGKDNTSDTTSVESKYEEHVPLRNDLNHIEKVEDEVKQIIKKQVSVNPEDSTFATKESISAEEEDHAVDQVNNENVMELKVESKNYNKIDTSNSNLRKKGEDESTLLDKQHSQNELKEDVLEPGIMNTEIDDHIKISSTDSKSSEEISPDVKGTETDIEVDSNSILNSANQMGRTTEIANKEDVTTRLNENNVVEKIQNNLYTDNINTEGKDKKMEINQQQKASEEISALPSTNNLKISKKNNFLETNSKEKSENNGALKPTEQMASAVDIIQNIMSSKISTQKPGVLDTLVRQYLNSFLNNEQSHVFQNENKSTYLKNQLNNNSKGKPTLDTNKVSLKKENASNTSTEYKSTGGKTNKPLLIKKERSRSQENVLSNEGKLPESITKNTKMRRVRSVGVIKLGENEHKSKIPTSARRSAGRRPLVRQLETDSRDTEEKLNIKKELSKADPKNSLEDHNISVENSTVIAGKTKNLPGEAEPINIKDTSKEVVKEPIIKKDINKVTSKENDITKEDVLIAKTILKGIVGAEKHIELIEEKIIPTPKKNSELESENYNKINNKNNEEVESKNGADTGGVLEYIKRENGPESMKTEKEHILDKDQPTENVPQRKNESEKEISVEHKSKTPKDLKEYPLEHIVDKKGVTERGILTDFVESKETELNNILLDKILPSTSLEEQDDPNESEKTTTENSDMKQRDEIKVNTAEKNLHPKIVQEIEKEDKSVKDISGSPDKTVKDKTDEAATTIQKTWRGFHVRKDLRQNIKNFDDRSEDAKKQEEIKQTHEKSKEETNAAVKIQSLWRGYVTRKINGNSRNKFGRFKSNQENAILKIQAVVRGYLERLKYQKLKGKNRTNVDNEKDILNSDILTIENKEEKESQKIFNEEEKRVDIEYNINKQKIPDEKLAENKKNENYNKLLQSNFSADKNDESLNNQKENKDGNSTQRLTTDSEAKDEKISPENLSESEQILNVAYDTSKKKVIPDGNIDAISADHSDTEGLETNLNKNTNEERLEYQKDNTKNKNEEEQNKKDKDFQENLNDVGNMLNDKQNIGADNSKDIIYLNNREERDIKLDNNGKHLEKSLSNNGTEKLEEMIDGNLNNFNIVHEDTEEQKSTLIENQENLNKNKNILDDTSFELAPNNANEDKALPGEILEKNITNKTDRHLDKSLSGHMNKKSSEDQKEKGNKPALTKLTIENEKEDEGSKENQENSNSFTNAVGDTVHQMVKTAGAVNNKNISLSKNIQDHSDENKLEKSLGDLNDKSPIDQEKRSNNETLNNLNIENENEGTKSMNYKVSDENLNGGKSDDVFNEKIEEATEKRSQKKVLPKENIEKTETDYKDNILGKSLSENVIEKSFKDKEENSEVNTSNNLIAGDKIYHQYKGPQENSNDKDFNEQKEKTVSNIGKMSRDTSETVDADQNIADGESNQNREQAAGNSINQNDRELTDTLTSLPEESNHKEGLKQETNSVHETDNKKFEKAGVENRSKNNDIQDKNVDNNTSEFSHSDQLVDDKVSKYELKQLDENITATKIDNDSDSNISNNNTSSDFKESHLSNKEKPDFYRSNTVLEPDILKKTVSDLGENNAEKVSLEPQPITENIGLREKDDNNNTQSKGETELESDVRSAVNNILKDNNKNKSSLETEIEEAVKNIMENNIDDKFTILERSDKQSEIKNDIKNTEKSMKEDKIIDKLLQEPLHEIKEQTTKDIDITDHSVENIVKETPNILSFNTHAQLDKTALDSDQTAQQGISKEEVSENESPNKKVQPVDQSTKNTDHLTLSPTQNNGSGLNGKVQPVDESIKNKDLTLSYFTLSATPKNTTDLHENETSSKSWKKEKDRSSSEINANDVSSVDSTDSVITVIPNVNYDTSVKRENVSGLPNVLNSSLHDIVKAKESAEASNKNLVKKSLSAEALKEHVELIDQVQNTLLDQISGKSLNTSNKFDIEQLRKELHEATSLYKSEDEDPRFINHDDELLEYLNDFEPEDDNVYDSKIIKTPVRELPDIEEEVDSSIDDIETTRKAAQLGQEFCKTPSTTGAQKLIDNKPLKDHVETVNVEKLKQGHNEIIINNDNIQIKTTDSNSTGNNKIDSNQKLLHTGELHDSVLLPMTTSSVNRSDSGKLKHTSEFHDTLVVPLPSGADVNIKNEAKEMLANDKPTELKRKESVDTGNQTAFQQSPAGASIVTSRRSLQDGVDVVEAQASLRDTSPAKPKSVESFTHQSPPQSPRFVEQEMESENNNNKKNNASSNNVSSPGKNMEAEAAVKIQAGFRGYQVRKQLKTKNASTDKPNQERQVRRKSSGRKNMKDTDLAEKSAVKIQAGVRGFLVRRRQKKQLSSSASA